MTTNAVRSLLFIAVVVQLSFEGAAAATPYAPGMKTIGTAIKGGTLKAATEQTLFEHDGGPGVITEQWFTGMNVMDDKTRIRIYIDGESASNVSLDFMLYMAHGIGSNVSAESPNTPWGTERLAHTGPGSIYNTIRIPFTKTVRITAEHPVGGAFWYIVRGVENYPLVLGDIQLPQNAHLKLYKNVDLPTSPLDFVTVANVTKGTSGALFMVSYKAVSADYTYLEACFRAFIDGSEQPLFLSSGTEDMFLSSYYYATGLYHENNAGCTAKTDAYAPEPAPHSGPTDVQNYYLAQQGQTCTDFCKSKSLVCNTDMYLGENRGTDVIKHLNLSCQGSLEAWWAPDQPNYVSGKSDPNYRKCLGFVGYPAVSDCDASYPTAQRVCHCTKDPAPAPQLETMTSAYKLFENDPVFFADGFELVWRNGEQSQDQSPKGCPNTWPPKPSAMRSSVLAELEQQKRRAGRANTGQPAPVNSKQANYTTYAWVYEWPSQ